MYCNSMTSLIQIKETSFNKEIIQIEHPDGLIRVEWDSQNTAVNLRIKHKVFWLYTPDVVTIRDVVVPNITLRTIIKLLGYANYPITLTLRKCDSNILDKLIYYLPLCSIVIHPINNTKEYSYFESGFTPLLELSY